VQATFYMNMLGKVHGLDRVTRIILGVLLVVISFAAALSATWFAIFEMLAIYALTTGMTAWDPFYHVVASIKQYCQFLHLFHGK